MQKKGGHTAPQLSGGYPLRIDTRAIRDAKAIESMITPSVEKKALTKPLLRALPLYLLLSRSASSPQVSKQAYAEMRRATQPA